MLAQLYSSRATWRWGSWISIIICGINFVALGIFYRPPPRSNIANLNQREIISRIDFIGMVLSTSGFALFFLGIQWGGYN
jgi:hypothetical protein